MKTYISISIIILGTILSLNGQHINWSSPASNSNNLAHLNIGYDYGFIFKAGYGHKVIDDKSLWLMIDFSEPMGGDKFDDFKSRIGIQTKVATWGNFVFSTLIYSNYRQHRNELVTMKSFGTEISGAVGLYKSTWFIIAELGFDKAIITQLNHTKQFKDNYSEVHDGWYIPTGGNWFYGFQYGKSIGSSFQLSLELGTTNAQGNDQDALIPKYFRLGLLNQF